jgi:thioredoxin-like negative regulator of GroEL
MLEVDVDNQREVAAEYSVTAMPTLIFFQNKKELKRIRGADSNGIVQAVQELASKNPQAVRRGSTAADGSSGSSGTSSSNIKSMAKEVSNYIAKGFEIINDIIHFGDAEILNVETASSSDTLRGCFLMPILKCCYIFRYKTRLKFTRSILNQKSLKTINNECLTLKYGQTLRE